jgi:general secretion pathway protein K
MAHEMRGPPSLHGRERTAPDGFIIVAVLWILGALSAMVSIYAVYVINTAYGFAEYDDRLRAEALVSAAIELTAHRQLSAPAVSRSTQGEFGFRLGRAHIGVDFRSEAARIDLNAAPKELLAGLFHALGARASDAKEFGDRVVGWRTAPQNGQDPEASAYQSAGLNYRPRGTKFPHVNELSLVRLIPAALVERALPLVTVYSGRPQINVNDAAPVVLAALPGMTPERVEAVLAQRRAAPDKRQAVLQLLGASQQYATTEGSGAFRVTVRIAFDNGRNSLAEVVILLFEGGNEPFSVLSWRDEAEVSRTGAL